ncbi:MAG: hypothetical protein ABI374_13535, partial [Ginsengibacter sp.]
FKNDSGIIAARNPIMQPQTITIKLDPAKGLADSACSLVLERTYPTHWISPNLYAAGATITLPLQGYEAAIYEVYPLKSAKRPLLAGADFEVTKKEDRHYTMHLLDNGSDVKFLNPSMIESVKINNKEENINRLNVRTSEEKQPLTDLQNNFRNGEIKTDLTLPNNMVSARYVVFLKTDTSFNGKNFPEIVLNVDGKKVKPTIQQQQGSWATYSFKTTETGKHNFELKLNQSDKVKNWKGEANVWLIVEQKKAGNDFEITTNESIKVPPMPPSPYAAGVLMQNIFLGKGTLVL